MCAETRWPYSTICTQENTYAEYVHLGLFVAPVPSLASATRSRQMRTLWPPRMVTGARRISRACLAPAALFDSASQLISAEAVSISYFLEDRSTVTNSNRVDPTNKFCGRRVCSCGRSGVTSWWWTSRINRCTVSTVRQQIRRMMRFCKICTLHVSSCSRLSHCCQNEIWATGTDYAAWFLKFISSHVTWHIQKEQKYEITDHVY